ncbi:MAG: glycosyltransferase family 2 protein [Anaerolineae bacterium]
MEIPNLFISVVVPAFNEEKYISHCLQSLMLLDYPPDLYEVIVVNNNSTDQTGEIVSRDFSASTTRG